MGGIRLQKYLRVSHVWDFCMLYSFAVRTTRCCLPVLGILAPSAAHAAILILYIPLSPWIVKSPYLPG